MTVFTPKKYDDREIEVWRTEDDTRIEIRTAGTSQEYLSAYLDDETAHALAAWILENVPKPTPKPLPEKFGAVIRTGGILFTLANPEEEPKWRSPAQEAAWRNGYDLQERGFEVIFEGVERG